MRKFVLRYLIPRIIQYLTIIFVGITVTFIIPRLAPTDPVQAQVSMMIARGSALDPASIESMRSALTDLYGLSGSPIEQYFTFWGRLFRGDLGPSLGNFPTPVSKMIGQALPYTLRLLIPAVIISFLFGNLFGALSSYYPHNIGLNVIEVLGQAVRSIPYYIVAIVLLVVFAYFIPIFPFSGAYPIGTRPDWSSLDFLWAYFKHGVLPAATLVLVGFGGWFVGMKSLTSNIISEDYVVYAETAGLKKNKILVQYIMRTAMLPQLTALAMSLGTVFSGALIMEVVFGYPGIGSLAIVAVYRNDYSMIMGITIYSIIGVATAVFIMDLLYPLFDPRVRYQ
ncbi:MAG TPA: ABC transporter permease [Aggregatilinea sp.]|jgi:peptide/nickel transport system permease protein|uniref:ABC transporter permease n=1 Tax=Aggregatilinea sp. TaxID=2806333 RepID=UPI002B72D7A4|nr:ABC transporter permease [Aggregatilinea sp.]HML20922.1 ABC transporter permease [Aggregatilinea sp.]